MTTLRLLPAAAMLLALAGCAPKVLPDDYTGLVAVVSDTVIPTGGSSGQFFVLWQVEDRYTDDSITRTQRANSGRGLSMTPVTTTHRIPARPATVRLKGTYHYAAPILALLNPAYEVDGRVAFDPKPDGRYAVRGELSAAYSAIWIEDATTGQPVTAKVERR